jgi:hypothetical protein
MGWITFVGLALAVLLSASLHAASVIIVEVPDDDAIPVTIKNVVDGDTVELRDGRRVRLVGYDAYELTESLGALARRALSDLCAGEAYLDIDDYEPRDRYGRVLGYLWCRRGAGDVVWYVSAQKYFILGEGRKYVKRLLHIPPDEHPHSVWTTRHVVKFDKVTEIYVYNDTRSPHRMHDDSIVLTSGVYELHYGGRVARLRLMNGTHTAVIHLPENAATETAPAAAPTAAVQTATETTATTEKPYARFITYAAVVAAVAVLAVYMARRGRPRARR